MKPVTRGSSVDAVAAILKPGYLVGPTQSPAQRSSLGWHSAFIALKMKNSANYLVYITLTTSLSDFCTNDHLF